MMEKDVDFRIDPTQRICEKCGNLVGKVFELCPKCVILLQQRRKVMG